MIRLRAPSFDLAPGVVKGEEPVGVQAFIAQPAVEQLDQRIVGRLARPTHTERDLVQVGPLVEQP